MQKNTFLILCTLLIIIISSCGSDSGDPTPDVAPSGLTYSPSSYALNEGETGNSNSPTITGTTPITFSLAGNNENAISINSSSGVISSTGSLAAGTYQLSVIASNSAGSPTFSNAFSITVSESNVAPSGLAYASTSIVVGKHETVTSSAPSITGSQPLTFEITNASSLPSQISINNASGAITVANGLNHGTYSVDVKASNSAGEVSVTGAMTISSQEVVFNGTGGIQGFFQGRCAPCHVSGGTRSDWTSYNTAKNNIDNIIARVSDGSMPQSGDALSQEEIDYLKQWKADGLLQ